MTRETAEAEFAAQALALAAIPDGRTSPNPRVGCVLVRDGQVVGAGYHRAAGEPHAEAVAASEAGALARGATAYVSLEPCAHHGRTPPCADLLVASGVARVVAPIRDPNPLVDGRGFERLRSAGIAIEVGAFEREARRINRPFFSVHERGRPWVTLKAAATLDGRIAPAGGDSRWISGEASRRVAHRLRLRSDAVLVGAGTVRRDDPRLTVRLPDSAPSPVRAVLAPDLDLDPGARIFGMGATSPPRLYAARGLSRSRRERFERVAVVVEVDSGERGLDLGAVLADLCVAGVQSVLVEGGGRTWGSFLEAGLADSIALFVAPLLLGARGATPLADLEAPGHLTGALRLGNLRRAPIGSDEYWEATLAEEPCSPD